MNLNFCSPFLMACVCVIEGSLWLAGIAGSIAYNWSRPGMKTSVKLIHARYDSSGLGGEPL
jgi:hypothetical protein